MKAFLNGLATRLQRYQRIAIATREQKRMIVRNRERKDDLSIALRSKGRETGVAASSGRTR